MLNCPMRGNTMLGNNSKQLPAICLGRVTYVDSVTRLYDVSYYSTNGQQGKRKAVQALCATVSLQGDESSSLAEAGTNCVLAFVGEVPYILGFYNPPQINKPDPSKVKNIETGRGNEGAVPGSASGGRASLDVGDQAFGTRGGNRIILRRSGIIEMEASKTCRRTMYPATDTISEICRNYDLSSDGLLILSKTVPPSALKSDRTYTAFVYKDNLSADNLIMVERGAVSPDDMDLIEKYSVGTAATKSVGVDETTYVRFQKVDGERTEAINPGGTAPDPDSAAWYRGVKADGSYEETINSKTYSITIDAEGNIIRKSAGKLTDTIEDDVTIEYGKSITRKIGKDLNEEVTGKVTTSHGSKYRREGSSGEFIELSGGKASIGNSTVELVDVVYRICQTLSKTLTPGYNGPISTAAEFTSMVTEIQSLKK
jgi:hypothetical protein